ncbi:MAG: hypothetical protein Q4D62_01035 [Planctomycetia bacterium]|nr:hypothetical protein [Planctomycetia bacterium]
MFPHFQDHLREKKNDRLIFGHGGRECLFRRFVWESCLGVVFWGILGGLACAEEKMEPLQAFRRVYVPQSFLDNLPTGGITYWPIAAEEFERWVKDYGQGTSPMRQDSAILARSATYQAALRPRMVLEGEGTLCFEKNFPDLPEASRPEHLFWRFPEVRFAMNEVYGVRLSTPQTSESEKPSAPVMRSVHFYPDGSGELELFKSDFQEGKCWLDFQWSQRGEMAESGKVVFSLQFLPATNIVLDLQLPGRWTPQIRHGLVELRENVEVPQGWKAWRFHLGGNPSVELELTSSVREEITPAVRPAVAVSQHNHYQFHKEGLDVTCQMTLESIGTSERKNATLQFQLEEGFLLTEVLYQSQMLKWSYQTQGEDSERLAIVELPESISGQGNLLELKGIQEMPAPTSQETAVLRKLPKIRLLDVLWKEGKTEVEVVEPLEVVDLDVKESRILQNRRSRHPNAVIVEIQEFSPYATVQMAIRNQPAGVRLDTTTAVNFLENEIASQMEITASIADGECFEIRGLVNRSWTIDSIETLESGVIEDWNLDVSPDAVGQVLRGLTPEQGKTRLPQGWDEDSLCVLRIQLAHSVRPHRNLSFKIKARRLEYPQNYLFTGIQLTPVYFPEYQTGESWILAGTTWLWRVRFLEPYRSLDVFWENTPSETQFTSFSATLTRARELFPEKLKFLVATQDFKDIPMIQLERRPKAFTASVEGFYDLTSSPHAIYRIQCDPQGSLIDTVRVQIRPGSLLGVTWNFPKNLLGSEARSLGKKSYNPGGDIQDSSELWEIKLRNPQQEPFEIELVLLTDQSLIPQHFSNGEDEELIPPADQVQIRAWWTSRFPEGVKLPLVHLPQAQQCTGQVSLQRDITDDLFVQAEEMVPILSPSSEGNGHHASTEGVWTYRYSPSSLTNTISPSLRLQWKNGKETQQAWIWKEEYQTQCFPGGVALHVATLRIENLGENFLTVSLPEIRTEEISLFGVIVNGQRILNATHRTQTKESGEEKERTLRISLPVWQRNHEVIIQWVSKISPLGVCSVLEPPRLKTNFLVLQSSWKVWIPDNYVPLNPVLQNREREGDDTVLLRILGNFRLGKSIFNRTPSGNLAEIPSPVEENQVNRRMLESGEPLSLVAISQDVEGKQEMVGWSCYQQTDSASLWIVNGNAMEATRWFGMLLAFWISFYWLSPWRPLRVGLCGISAVLALLVPLSLSPVFSGFFLGLLLTFGWHSVVRYQKRQQDNTQKRIRILGENEQV